VLDLLSPTLFSTVSAAKYQIQDSYIGQNWLDGFQFEAHDGDNGFVDYQDQAGANRVGLYATIGTDVLFAVDLLEPLNYRSAVGRKSVRFEGKKDYSHGIFVLDVKRMSGTCGLWPSFGSLGREPVSRTNLP
jgi:hypothetical protein